MAGLTFMMLYRRLTLLSYGNPGRQRVHRRIPAMMMEQHRMKRLVSFLNPWKPWTARAITSFKVGLPCTQEGLGPGL